MALSQKDAAIVAEVAKRYGDVLDLKKSPSVLIEILRNFSGRVLDPPDGGTGTGGVSPGTGTVSTVAVGITPPETVGTVADLNAIMKGILKLQRDVNAMSKVVAGKAGAKAKSRAK